MIRQHQRNHLGLSIENICDGCFLVQRGKYIMRLGKEMSVTGGSLGKYTHYLSKQQHAPLIHNVAGHDKHFICKIAFIF